MKTRRRYPAVSYTSVKAIVHDFACLCNKSDSLFTLPILYSILYSILYYYISILYYHYIGYIILAILKLTNFEQTKNPSR